MEAQEIKTLLVQSIVLVRILVQSIGLKTKRRALAKTTFNYGFLWYYLPVMVSIVECLKNSIRGVFDGLGIVVKEIHLEHPEVPAHGDFSTNAALHYAKDAGKNPRELA